MTHEYESAFLDFKTAQRATKFLGHFYGDPSCALISRDEKFAVIGGDGLLVYFLQKPFLPYKNNTACKQYFEKGRKSEQIISVSSLFQDDADDNTFFRYEVKMYETTEVWRVSVESRIGELMEIRSNENA
ncbi:MAG: hypothetical protein IM638_10325 [Bacteroidetes bacterium]|nr:hypothetical protein [Bacteroidota bacterium]